MTFLPLILTIAGAYTGGIGFHITVLYIAVAHPLADWLSHGRFQKLNTQIFPDVQLWLHAVAQLGLVVWSLWFVSSRELAFGELSGLVFSVGMCTGITLTAAHELIHRPARWQRGLGVALLWAANYMHYRVEHVFGHHKKVATPEDPATARRGEGLYAFWLRSILGSFASALELERKRTGRFWNRRNRMLHYFIVQAAGFAAIFAAFGVRGFLFFAAQSLVAVLLLETVHYIEHYGLLRKRNAHGDYEPYAARHTWDSDHFFTNKATFNVGRHSHHHKSPTVPYEKLEVLPDALPLPAGYSAMLLLALAPPLWRAVIDPRLPPL
ncbi:MAG TPA: alkane 1-monooxygenase [Bdellovibrionales bacterium]|nr:alkane 1-monooxygenase [Bdellovibrionales bacterium]